MSIVKIASIVSIDTTKPPLSRACRAPDYNRGDETIYIVQIQTIVDCPGTRSNDNITCRCSCKGDSSIELVLR